MKMTITLRPNGDLEFISSEFPDTQTCKIFCLKAADGLRELAEKIHPESTELQ